MSSVDTEESSVQEPHARSITVTELCMIGALIGMIPALFMSIYAPLAAHDKVRTVISEKVLSRGDLAPCSVLIDTRRHEGKCGSFGKYTVLSGGDDLFVFSGSMTDPTFVGSTGAFGFRATQELRDFALAD